MNVRVLSVFAFVMLLMGAGCSGVVDERPTEDHTIGGEEMTEDMTNVEETSFEEDGATVVIKKNTETNEATVHVSMELADDEEYVDFLGEQLAAAPMAINLACGLYQYAFFDEEGLKLALEESGGVMNEPRSEVLDEALGDAIVTMYELVFMDAEDGEYIASCMATGAGEDQIEFEVNREYPAGSTLFDMSIGELAI